MRVLYHFVLSRRALFAALAAIPIAVRAGKVGMPFGICATALVPRAMKCPLRAACFSGDHPPVHDWAAKD